MKHLHGNEASTVSALHVRLRWSHREISVSALSQARL
jgi:hypothetical protein